MLFSAADYNVQLCDKEPKQLTEAIKEIEAQLKHLEKLNLLRGHLSIKQQLDNITTTENIIECVNDAIYIQVAAYFVNGYGCKYAHKRQNQNI